MKTSDERCFNTVYRFFAAFNNSVFQMLRNPGIILPELRCL